MEPPLDIKKLPIERDAVAPDGSDVRILLGLKGGGMAHFRLPAGGTSIAVTHHTVEEIWYFVEGNGEMWRKRVDSERIDQVEPGVCLTVPLGTHFQFRTTGPTSLGAVGVTMPPWPGEGEARIVDGKWTPTVTSGMPR